MRLTVSPLDKEAEKRLIHILAEVALETGREKADREVCDDEASCRVLPRIDSDA